jgi:hypothetical protein
VQGSTPLQLLTRHQLTLPKGGVFYFKPLYTLTKARFYDTITSCFRKYTNILKQLIYMFFKNWLDLQSLSAMLINFLPIGVSTQKNEEKRKSE